MKKELAKALKETEGALEKIAKEGNIVVGSSMSQRSVSGFFHMPYSDMRHFTTFPCFQYRAPGGGRKNRMVNEDDEGALGRVAPPRAKVAKRRARAAPKGRAPAKRARKAKRAGKAAAVPTTPTSPEESSNSSLDWSNGEGGDGRDGGDSGDGAAGAASGPPAAGAASGPPPVRRARLRVVEDSEDDLDVPLTQRGVPVPANLFPSEKDSDLDRPLAARRNLEDQLSQAPTQDQSAPARARA